MALWHLTINRMDWIPFDHHHLSDSLVFFPTCLLSVAATHPHLLYTLLPDSLLCIRCCLSIAVQTDAAVVSWRSIGIHSHMTVGEWWIMAGRHAEMEGRGGGGREREKLRLRKGDGHQPHFICGRACVHPYKVRTEIGMFTVFFSLPFRDIETWIGMRRCIII